MAGARLPAVCKRAGLQHPQLPSYCTSPLLACSSASAAASRSWLKLRAFGLTQYDAVLLVDPWQPVVGDLAPLFALPTDFAAGWDQVGGLGGRKGWSALCVCGVH